ACGVGFLVGAALLGMTKTRSGFGVGTSIARPRIHAKASVFCHPERSGRSPRSRRILKTSYP
ncbi:MAG: hypothetical protein IJU94_00585, partial [Clostridia bacterium]|nr:hypothetical protein [Clostridia bacterium]